jgi:hypothetical protein
MFNYTQKEAVENISHFEHKEAMGGLASIAAITLLAMLFTDKKAQGEALEQYPTSNSNAAQYRTTAKRLVHYHGETLQEIVNGEKSLGAATNALAEFAKQFMRLGVNGKPVMWAEKNSYNEGTALSLLPLMPDLELKAQEKHAIKLAVKAKIEADKEVEQKASNAAAWTAPITSNISENSENKKKEPTAKKARDLFIEAKGLIDRICGMSDDTSVKTLEDMVMFMSIPFVTEDGDLTPAERLFRDLTQSALRRLNDKGTLDVIYHKAA